MEEVQIKLPEGIHCYTVPEFNNAFLDEEDDAWDEGDYFIISRAPDAEVTVETTPIHFTGELDEDTGTPKFVYFLPPGPVYDNMTDLLVFINKNLQ